MNCRSDAPRRGLTASPTTGKIAKDYLLEAVKAVGGSGRELTKRIGYADASLSPWFLGQCEPTYGALIRIEEVTGVPIDDYIPEVKKGAELFRHANEWREAFYPNVMKKHAAFIGEKKRLEILRGKYNENTLTIWNLVGVCEYKKWWDTGGANTDIACESYEMRVHPSPTTGKTFSQYVLDRMDERGMSTIQFATFIGESTRSVYRWIREECEPSLTIIRRIEDKFRISINSYIPEINRGVAILENWPSWREGFKPAAMRDHGITFGNGRFNAIRQGYVKEYGLTIRNLIVVCEYYDDWIAKNGGEKIEADGEMVYVSPEEEEVDEESYKAKAEKELEDDEPRYKEAMKAMRWAIGCFDGAEFKLKRTRKNVWRFETRHFYVCEIDFAEKELRVYYKKDGKLSFRRELYAPA